MLGYFLDTGENNLYDRTTSTVFDVIYWAAEPENGKIYVLVIDKSLQQRRVVIQAELTGQPYRNPCYYREKQIIDLRNVRKVAWIIIKHCIKECK